MFKHILICTDGSPLATKAFKGGIALAAALDAKVTAYYAIENMLPIYSEGYAFDQLTIDRFETAIHEVGKKHVDTIGKLAKAAGVSFVAVIAKAATPHDGIIAAAKKHKCDAIVLASHGRSGLTKLFMGSVTQQVLAHSKIPVVVFR